MQPKKNNSLINQNTKEKRYKIIRTENIIAHIWQSIRPFTADKSYNTWLASRQHAHTERHESYLSSHTFHSLLFNLITWFQGLSVRLFTAAYFSVPRPCLPSLPTSRFDSKPQARLRHLKPRWPPVTQSAVTCRLTPSVFSTAVSLFSTKKHRLIFGVSKTTLWKNRRQLSKFILVEWALKHVGTIFVRRKNY